MKSELQKLLNANIPAEAVEEREAYKNGPKLSYLSGAYVINRLNEVLGQGNWGYSLKSLTKVYEGTIEQYSGEAFTTSYVATVGFWALIDGKGASFDEVGYGDGTDKKSPGKAHELATKEAVTDGIKRAAKNLGISMGLGLYMKSGEYVDEEKTKTAGSTRAAQITPIPSGRTSSSTEGNSGVSKSNTGTGEKLKEAVSQVKVEEAPKSTKVQRQSIKSYFSVLKAKGVITTDLFKEKYLGGRLVDELSDEDVPKTLTRVKTDFKEQLSL
jgi:recombination DNA repair RAD52 pathway protein